MTGVLKAYGQSECEFNIELGSEMMVQRLQERFFRIARSAGRADVRFKLIEPMSVGKRRTVRVHCKHRCHNKGNVWCDVERAVQYALRDLKNPGAPPRYQISRVSAPTWKPLPCPDPKCIRSECLHLERVTA